MWWPFKSKKQPLPEHITAEDGTHWKAYHSSTPNSVCDGMYIADKSEPPRLLLEWSDIYPRLTKADQKKYPRYNPQREDSSAVNKRAKNDSS